MKVYSSGSDGIVPWCMHYLIDWKGRRMEKKDYEREDEQNQ